MKVRFFSLVNLYRGVTAFGILTCVSLGHAGWQLTWSDEFNSSLVATTNWTFDIGTGPPYPGWGNNELEYYTSRTNNVFLADGLLHIVARQESYSGSSYTSAKLKTSGLFSQTYGRFEFYAKLPTGQGYWPALWMMPQNPTYGGWAASGEIDVMENRGSDATRVLGTIHFGGTWPNNTYSQGPSYQFAGGDSVTNFHLYAVEWEEGAIRWYVDNQLFQTQTSWWSSGGAYPAPFNQPFYLMMNLAVGGNFGGNPDGTAVFPGEMLVDYVRVYKWISEPQPLPTLRLRVPLDEPTGSTTSTATNGSGASITMQMVNGAGTATDLHGAVNSGVAGSLTGGRAMNFAQAGNQPLAPGPLLAATNANLGFGSVSNFVMSVWFKQNALMADGANIGPRLFVLGAGTPTDTGAANSIGLKFQTASQLYFQLGGVTASANFATNLPANTWLFLAATYDGSLVRLYQGTDTTPVTLLNTTAATGNINFGSSGALYIGNRQDRQRAFNGWIDDLRFYSGAGDLSFVEVVRSLAVGVPLGVVATPGNNSVNLNWSAVVGATGYNVKRSANVAGPFVSLPNGTNITSNSFTDSDVLNGTTYYYTVSVLNVAGEGAGSAPVAAMPTGGGQPNEPQPYAPPTSHRQDLILDAGWRFIRQDVSGAEAASFDDGSWTNINLPHTWNNLDGQDGGNNYYRGIGWYRKHFPVDGGLTNRAFFLKFDGAFSVADVYVNGSYVGQHQGGFAAFTFDVTPYLSVGADNVVAVKVNNAFNADIPPLNADFTFFGGLHREVHFLVTDRVQISPLDYGSPGIYLKTTGVSSNSANLQVTAVLSNATATAQSVAVRTVVVDAQTNIVATMTNLVTLPATSGSNVVANTVLANPRLWDGLNDPYLYQTFTEVIGGTNVLDLVAQPLGLRSFSVDPANGFYLNGRHYDLHGVNMHQDWLDQGWALSDAQRETNFSFIKEIGATFLRLSHYQHHDYTYQLADRSGLCVWSEIPVINYITASSGFSTNTVQQLREMIRQNYNHPSVICWSVYNEITLQGGPSSTSLISQAVQLAMQEDPMRFPTAAANTSDNDPTTQYNQIIAFNKYYGWYQSPLDGIGAWADNIHATYPTRCFGIGEYGAGASINQHSENPTLPGNTASAFHPEEWQNIVHETTWQLMAARPFLWCKLLWNGFDFAADGRNEGDTPGRNDKGLVTYDRKVRKDAFYYYKAQWTETPTVYITGHTFTNRLTNNITAKVYANCDSVELFLNGVSQGSRTSTNRIFTWPLSLLAGTNLVQATGSKGGTNVTDALIWNAPIAPPVVTVLTPVGAIAYLHDTNDTLQLSVAVSNPVPANPLTTTWTQISGPGAVGFSNPDALTTTASFPSDGIYSVGLTASNGGITMIPFTIVVGATGEITNGLVAWWRMNETGGSTAADSSGNGRDATLSGAVFTNFATGYPTSALRFNGSSSYATFASPDITQLTVVAWARAINQGNSQFPRIFNTPGYRLFFRFDPQGNNGFDFATFSTGNGDWFSGVNTISLGAWYHVAASYDLANLASAPAQYINGIKVATPTVITPPSGTQPSSAGTGYIGNVAALNRAWNGELSDLRIYNRILSGAEIQILAHESAANYAPTISAGGDQTVIWPSVVSLTGVASDDDKPNPPAALTTTWSKITGPGVVTFNNLNLTSTAASFSVPGAYRLQLAANDGQATTISSLLVNVITRPNLSPVLMSNALQLSWSTDGGKWLLQYQTNPAAVGLNTNWMPVPGLITNPFIMPVLPDVGSVFYRLMLTNQ